MDAGLNDKYTLSKLEEWTMTRLSPLNDERIVSSVAMFNPHVSGIEYKQFMHVTVPPMY